MNNNKTALIGLSGGVDSSVSALLLKKQGYKLIGAYMENFSDKATKEALCKRFDKEEDREMAKIMATFLGIKLIILDCKDEYKNKVIKPMINSYKSGLTPNPDSSCNKLIKFPFLWREAKKLKADYIATGHYAKIKMSKSGYELFAGKDKTKDQSYFLYSLSQEDLSHLLFPIGNLTKAEVRKIARKYKFPNYNKPGTKGLCFVGKMNMFSYLKKHIPQKVGNVLSPEGKIIGVHPGISYYTIGQRIGPRLGFELFKPNSYNNLKLYVAEKRKNNVLVAAPKNHPLLKRKFAIIKSLYLINPHDKIPRKLKARMRHLGPLISGKLFKKSGKYIFKFNKLQEKVADGQSIVLYSKDKVIGGGEIRG